MEAGKAERGGGQVQSQDGGKDGRNLCICVTLMFLGFLLLIGFGFLFPRFVSRETKTSGLERNRNIKLYCVDGTDDCGHSVCINKSWVCDYQDDCVDASDELNCGCVLTSCQNGGNCHAGDDYGFDCECPDVADGTYCERVAERLSLGAGESTLIVSPCHPASYPGGLNLAWVVQTAEAHKLRLVFGSFATVGGLDVLEIGEGGSYTNASGRFFSWSGSRGPPALLTDSSEAWLTFTSMSWFGENGFQINVTSVPNSENLVCETHEFNCGHSVCINQFWECDLIADCHDQSDEDNCDGRENVYVGAGKVAGVTYLPYSPEFTYGWNMTWVLHTDPGWMILVDFILYDAQKGSHVLLAKDGLNGTSELLRWSGGGQLPATFLFAEDTLLLQFTTDGIDLTGGFSLYAFGVQANANGTCPSDEFDCGFAVCIQTSLVCDSENDCYDARDEDNCQDVD